ncbi:hypothetical protein LRP49_06460 [Enterovibrio sp. ZSDZ35]|uniref:ATPase n=1 Tax=Enterovibrio qingdaonensis TaxID=2899818 RepID=A0ABT5QKL8_9GAMM|nr:hypothetical protein [Enterovibrio sp. ZSDZ35]MDD1780841.1 hypothetical protein [Enterovibrio sp. ZSDZ35]
MERFKKAVVMMTMATLLTACQSTSEPRQVASQTNAVSKQSQNTMALYEKAKADYQGWLGKMNDSKTLRLYSNDAVNDLFDAWDDTVDVYEEFSANPGKLSEDYSSFSSGTYGEVFEERLAIVAAQHTSLLELKGKADALLAAAIAEMAYLDTINANDVFPNKYKSIKKTYQRLFTYVADNDIDDAQVKQAEFLNKAKSLESDIAMQLNFVPLAKELALLKREGFKSVAPISFTKASATLEQAEATVKLNPRDTVSIEQAVASVTFEISHLKHVGQEVKRFRSVDDGKFEPLVLELENRLHSIAQALGELDLRSKSMQKQSEELVLRVSNLSDVPDVDPRLENLMAKLDAVNSDLTNSDTEKDALSAKLSKAERQNIKYEGMINELRMMVYEQKQSPAGEGTQQPAFLSIEDEPGI